MEFRDYYEIMGVKRDATQAEIKRAYRKLARKYHPDVSDEAQAEARFKEIGEAYEVLKDPEKRAAYDELGANWKNGQDFKPPPNWNQGYEFHGGGVGGGGARGGAEQFSDFFESLFGGGPGGGPGGGMGGARQAFGRAGRHARGDNSHARVAISLEDAYHGASRKLSLKQSVLGPDGRPQVKQRTLNVRIPKGVRQGQNIRLANQGSPGAGQGEPGDLYLEIEFEPHAYYHVEGKDVYLDLPIAPWEAALGATVKVPTPAGNIDLKIPANSSSGRKLRLKGRGIPDKVPGDMYVVLQISMPPANSDADKAAWEQLQAAFDFDPRQRITM